MSVMIARLARHHWHVASMTVTDSIVRYDAEAEADDRHERGAGPRELTPQEVQDEQRDVGQQAQQRHRDPGELGLIGRLDLLAAARPARADRADVRVVDVREVARDADPQDAEDQRRDVQRAASAPTRGSPCRPSTGALRLRQRVLHRLAEVVDRAASATRSSTACRPTARRGTTASSRRSPSSQRSATPGWSWRPCAESRPSSAFCTSRPSTPPATFLRNASVGVAGVLLALVGVEVLHELEHLVLVGRRPRHARAALGVRADERQRLQDDLRLPGLHVLVDDVRAAPPG